MVFDRGTKYSLAKQARQTDLNSYKAVESNKQNLKGVP